LSCDNVEAFTLVTSEATGTRFGDGLPRRRSNSARKPPSSYRSRQRRMCRPLILMISAA
jgi:hypothetical protein